MLGLTAGKGDRMGRLVDLSVTVDSRTMSPPSTNMRLELTPHHRGPGFWQVSSVQQSLHTGAHIDSPLHVFRNGITTAEIMDFAAPFYKIAGTEGAPARFFATI
jgi:kynurenine formamidase